MLIWSGGMFSKGKKGVPLDKVTRLQRGRASPLVDKGVADDDKAAARCIGLEVLRNES
jgi:hypothetical protein